MIETRELTRRFGGVDAVEGLTMSVRDRGVVGFLGPNGAGKTTTMRMLTGFLAPTSGSARVAGFDVTDQPLEVKARVGYLPETPPLYPDLTVGEFLLFVAELRGVGRSIRAARVGRTLEQVGLRGWEKRRLGGLSKGYRQRVGLAQALVHDPALLVLDEPTSGLDPAQVVGVRELIRGLAEERTVVLSTHVLAEVEASCERVLLLHRGRLVGDGTVDELAERTGTGGRVELSLDDETEDLRGPLAALPEVDQVERTGPSSYRLRGGTSLEPALAAWAVGTGRRVRCVVRRPASLEAVFLALVGEGT
ncbi:MAG: ABC transporter ATP-binding protein [Alphaproteobacteria bacterium]|nr:ABC transporter ATP-binding protein [Alphaproteobacteria bacterium]